MSIKDNLDGVRERIYRALDRSGRKPGEVTLLGVSKFHPASSVLEAVAAGLTLFGENRVQEASGKFPAILAENPSVSLHLIGSLQRNKARTIVPLASCIESVDRIELLEELERRSAELGKTMDILFEYHTAEDSKSGYPDRDTLFRSLDRLRDMEHLRCRGLMTMAPFTEEPLPVRKSFRALKALQEDCARRYPELDFSVLSMGMSSDFEAAVEEGSTLVRVGTAIFGGRP